MAKRILLFFILLNVSLAYARTLSIESNAFQYSQVYTDPESHLQYLNARYYNPATQRFITRDSYHLLNRYAYADGNPMMNEDPRGHSAEGIAYFFTDGATGLSSLLNMGKSSAAQGKLTKFFLVSEETLTLAFSLMSIIGSIKNDDELIRKANMVLFASLAAGVAADAALLREAAGSKKAVYTALGANFLGMLFTLNTLSQLVAAQHVGMQLANKAMPLVAMLATLYWKGSMRTDNEVTNNNEGTNFEASTPNDVDARVNEHLDRLNRESHIPTGEKARQAFSKRVQEAPLPRFGFKDTGPNKRSCRALQAEAQALLDAE